MIHSGQIATPHPDIELGQPREPLRFRYALPQAPQENMGAIFYIHGYGGAFDDPYTDSLLPFLADHYGCVAVAVEYFGAKAYGPCVVGPSADFVEQVTAIYKARIPPDLDEKLMPQWFDWVIRLIGSAGNKVMDPRVNIVRHVREYNSFGLLPALDHLEVLAHLLQILAIDSRRVFVIGTSYGGYIALLLAKLAPDTFRMIVDNSGFTSASDDMNAVFGWIGADVLGVSIKGRTVHHWDENPDSPQHFSESHAAIRDLFRDDHLTGSALQIYSFHSREDRMTPIARKQAMIAGWQKKFSAELMVIGPEEVDGRVFKSLDHGMNASMRGLFDLAYRRLMETPPIDAMENDFVRQTQKLFSCGDRDYLIAFEPNGVRVSTPSASDTRLLN